MEKKTGNEKEFIRGILLCWVGCNHNDPMTPSPSIHGTYAYRNSNAELIVCSVWLDQVDNILHVISSLFGTDMTLTDKDCDIEDDMGHITDQWVVQLLLDQHVANNPKFNKI